MSAATPAERHAERLLRCYPRAWRERYGEEFAALLMEEWSERPRCARRTANVMASGLVARLSGAGMTGGLLDGPAQARASLAALICTLAAFLALGVSMWAQLTIGWQWSAPDTTGTAIAVVAMTGAVIVFAALAARRGGPGHLGRPRGLRAPAGAGPRTADSPDRIGARRRGGGQPSFRERMARAQAGTPGPIRVWFPEAWPPSVGPRRLSVTVVLGPSRRPVEVSAHRGGLDDRQPHGHGHRGRRMRQDRAPGPPQRPRAAGGDGAGPVGCRDHGALRRCGGVVDARRWSRTGTLHHRRHRPLSP